MAQPDQVLADAGYRVVAPDLRGYGQTDAPCEVDDYDQTHIVGDAVGLMGALGEESAVLVGQDFGSWVGYYCVAMRPELFTGLFMMCSPPSPRPASSPAEAFKSFPQDLEFYQEYFTRPGTAAEITEDLRGYLTGVYYSTSGACTDEEQWRAFWHKDVVYLPLVLPLLLPESVEVDSWQIAKSLIFLMLLPLAVAS